MRFAACFAAATERLQKSGVSTARLDSLVLLEDILKTPRANLLAHPEREVTPEQVEQLQLAITRRASHEPLAYIRGKAPFYGRDFFVTPDVLVPRPETEALIELFAGLALPKHPKIIDVGTGSGCIGITLALEYPHTTVDLCDISPAAVVVAAKNAKQLEAHNVQVQQRDLLEGVQRDTYDIVVANLPYVPKEFPINRAASHEPALALFSGEDGLDHYRTFWQQIKQLSPQPQYVLCESFPTQHIVMSGLAQKADYTLLSVADFVQLFGLNSR